jgi:hypothetical protein
MKPPQDFQTTSLIFLATVFLFGVRRLDGEGRRFVPASFDLGVNERKKYDIVVARDRRADDVKLERLRVLDRASRL